MLPIFSYEEEAEMFLRLEGVGNGWRVSESGAGELASVLHESCAGARRVILDPLPKIVADRIVGLVSLDRKRFVECLIAGGKPTDAAIWP